MRRGRDSNPRYRF